MTKRRLTSLFLAVLMIAAMIPFTAISSSADTLPANVFSDVKDGAWYTEATLYCYKYGYISGTGEALFSPGVDMNRAMFVTILYNIDSASEKYTTSSFADVKVGSWYANPVEWAYQNGYASGTGKDAKGSYFSPTSPVTRETLCVFLRTYAQAKGFDVDTTADLSVYTDKAQIHSWANNAVSWAVGEGLVSGLTKDTIAPRNTATRAQIALILKNFLGKYPIHVWGDGKVVTKRTCTVAGKTEFTCSDCGKTRTVEYKAWHTYDDGVVNAAPTCISSGKKTCTCKTCGNKKTVELPVNQDHRYVNGFCSLCGVARSPMDIIAGSWKATALIYEDGSVYSVDSTIYFNTNGKATFTANGETYYFNWTYMNRVEDGMALFYISNSNEAYYVYIDIMPKSDTFKLMFIDMSDDSDNFTVVYSR